MVTASSELGGGPMHLLTLRKELSNDIEMFFALPKSKYFISFEIGNCIFIKERKVSFRDIFKLALFIRQNSIDIIHAHGKGASLICRLLKLLTNKKLIYTYHGIHLTCHNLLYRIFYIIYENIFGLLDSHKIFVSKSEKNYAKKFFIIGKNNSIINNSVDKKNFINYENKEKNKRIFLKESRKVIISVCRFVTQKNIDEIIEIASRLSKYKFLIVGDGPLKKKIVSSINKLINKNVSLLGAKKNIYKYLSVADIYLSTSLYEGLPLSVLEAMSVGLPIVASNVIGNSDTIKHAESGYLYNLGDIGCAVRYIEEILTDKNLYDSFSINSYKRQRQLFSHKKMSKAYLDLYLKISGRF